MQALPPLITCPWRYCWKKKQLHRASREDTLQGLYVTSPQYGFVLAECHQWGSSSPFPFCSPLKASPVIRHSVLFPLQSLSHSRTANINNNSVLQKRSFLMIQTRLIWISLYDRKCGVESGTLIRICIWFFFISVQLCAHVTRARAGELLKVTKANNSHMWSQAAVRSRIHKCLVAQGSAQWIKMNGRLNTPNKSIINAYAIPTE